MRPTDRQTDRGTHREGTEGTRARDRDREREITGEQEIVRLSAMSDQGL